MQTLTARHEDKRQARAKEGKKTLKKSVSESCIIASAGVSDDGMWMGAATIHFSALSVQDGSC